MIIKNKLIEFNLILFPIWIGLLYLLLSQIINNQELLFLLFLLILGETHFASTFCFFFDKNNHKWLSKNKLSMFIIPILLILLYLVIGLQSLFAAVFIGSVFSAYHVTRQSVGISRLYGTKKNSFFELGIYFFSGLYLFIGFMRFFYNDIINAISLPLPLYQSNNNNIFLIILVSSIVFCMFNNGNYKKIFVTLSGCLIYAPYLFVDNPYQAVIIGVGAHWCQYLGLNYKIYFNKESVFKGYKRFMILLFIIIYAIIMSLLGYKGHVQKDYINYLILIPLTGQFFHYYTDMFIWRFSDSHIREYIGKNLFS